MAVGLVAWRFEKVYAFILGLGHALGCLHRGPDGRVPVGQTVGERIIFRLAKSFGPVVSIVGVLLIGLAIFYTFPVVEP